MADEIIPPTNYLIQENPADTLQFASNVLDMMTSVDLDCASDALADGFMASILTVHQAITYEAERVGQMYRSIRQECGEPTSKLSPEVTNGQH